jgi:hypothetical protein
LKATFDGCMADVSRPLLSVFREMEVVRDVDRFRRRVSTEEE